MMTEAQALLQALQSRCLTLATAESLTGGGIGAALTAIPGSSQTYLGGIISYTDTVKAQLLGVPQDTLACFGAVSAETAQAMARGALTAIGADLALSVTGLAGPTGDDRGNPVGLVYVACATAHATLVQRFHFTGSRDAIRSQTIQAALLLAHHAL